VFPKAHARDFRNRVGAHLTRLARRKAKNPKTKSEEEYETEDDTTITEVL